MTQSVFTKDYKLFRKMLVEERHKASLSQKALADRLGKPPSFVAKYELGERRLDIIELKNIAEAIGFDLVDFVSRL